MKKSIILLSFLLTSCATLINGKTQEVVINSSPAGADVTINNEYVGITPLDAKVVRKYDFDIILTKDGYVSVNKTYSKELDPIVLGNLFIGGIPGLIIDLASGSAYHFDVSNISLQLEKK